MIDSLAAFSESVVCILESPRLINKSLAILYWTEKCKSLILFRILTQFDYKN